MAEGKEKADLLFASICGGDLEEPAPFNEDWSPGLSPDTERDEARLTLEGWEASGLSWEDYAVPGMKASEGLVDHFMSSCPPAWQESSLAQPGEAVDRADGRELFDTFERSGDAWVYAGVQQRGGGHPGRPAKSTGVERRDAGISTSPRKEAQRAVMTSRRMREEFRQTKGPVRPPQGRG